MIAPEPWWGKYIPHVSTLAGGTISAIAAVASAFMSWRAKVAALKASRSSAAHRERDQQEHAAVKKVCEEIHEIVKNGNGKAH